MDKSKRPDGFLEDASEAGFVVDGKLILGDSLAKFAQLQRQREQVGEAVPMVVTNDMVKAGNNALAKFQFYLGNDEMREVCNAIVSSVTPPSPSRELLEKAIDACRKAKISDTGNKAVDAVHNGAVDDCVKYIRAILPQEPKEETPDNELPGMWERADFEGGKEEVRGPDWKPQGEQS